MVQSTTDPPAGIPPPAGGDPDGETVTELAARLGVVDALLFRRISPTTWAHLGGLGHGRRWAGLIDLDETDDPLATRIPAVIGGVTRVQFPEPSRILGPYYATAGALVRLSNDVAVVLGNPHDVLADLDDSVVLRLAGLVDATVDDVLPAKRLADELEVLHAVRDLMDAPTGGGLRDALHHVVQVAVRALTCDIGALRDGTGELVTAGQPSGLTDEQWHAVLDELAGRMESDTWCAQDTTATGPLLLTSEVPGVRSFLALVVPPPVGGLLVVLHTARVPRGFTQQCRRLGRHVVDTGSVVARTAALRDEMRAAVDRASHAARTDPLTGLGNRLAWDEAIAAAQQRVDGGGTASVVTLDLDGLKRINDERGHDAGDDLLRRCAATIRRWCAPGDLPVRMGGDEFAVLLHGGTVDAGERYTALAAEFNTSSSSAHAIAASVGLGTARAGGRLSDAVRDADVQMYQHKRARRNAGGDRPVGGR